MTEVWEGNATHNLTEMADEAGLYKPVWRPEEEGIKQAREMIPILEKGIERMKADPERYKKHNPSNGWGSYEGLIGFLERYLAACREEPDATIRASR